MTSKLVDDISADVTKILSYGDQVRIKLYTGSVALADYDDAQVLTQSGSDIWASGLNMPVKASWGSREAVLMENGKLTTNDKKIFVAGTVETGKIMKIGSGSPVVEEYSLIPEGVTCYPAYGTPAYKKMYCRFLPTGSLINE